MAPSLTGHIASEDGGVEKPALALLGELGWAHLNLMKETPGPANPTGRTSFKQTHLPARLYAALKSLNPLHPPEALNLAEIELTRDRSAMLPIAANREVHRFLDLIENFLLFEEARGGLRKVVAKYHQVLGVNRAIEAVDHITDNRGRLGVFWHTQGSGKSLSMAMFAEKVLRRKGGNFSFVIVTDRTELDDQIAATFAAVGALTKGVN